MSGLELHPEKTRLVDLREGREGFDFLGCHFHARVSGRMLERGVRRYYLQRWPSAAGDETYPSQDQGLTGRGRAGMDIRDVIAALNPILRGWGNYFRTGNAARKFIQIDAYVRCRFVGLDAETLRPQSAGRSVIDLDARVVRGSRPLPLAWHHPLSGTRVVTIRKTIGKPCAGKPHARIERGMGKRA